ncbi:AbrB family transcriptional regulator [Candidatus Pacearchaeota archaeon]|nr:AbrB family transcriptional regulator [Candidatus Pacearchaeota archaeon]
MDITKLSTKGQIVIPESIRNGFQEGCAFSVVRKGNLIVLKQVEGLTNKEVEEMQELDKIWKEIDEGKCESFKVEDFFSQMKEW